MLYESYRFCGFRLVLPYFRRIKIRHQLWKEPFSSFQSLPALAAFLLSCYIPVHVTVSSFHCMLSIDVLIFFKFLFQLKVFHLQVEETGFPVLYACLRLHERLPPCCSAPAVWHCSLLHAAAVPPLPSAGSH